MRGQVGCRASFNCAGEPGDDIGVADDGAGCCLDNPSAMAYPPKPKGSEDCFACVGTGVGSMGAQGAGAPMKFLSGTHTKSHTLL